MQSRQESTQDEIMRIISKMEAMYKIDVMRILADLPPVERVLGGYRVETPKKKHAIYTTLERAMLWSLWRWGEIDTIAGYVFEDEKPGPNHGLAGKGKSTAPKSVGKQSGASVQCEDGKKRPKGRSGQGKRKRSHKSGGSRGSGRSRRSGHGSRGRSRKRRDSNHEQGRLF